MTPIESADEKLAQRAVITLGSAASDTEILEGITRIFKSHPGKVPVFFKLDTPAAMVTVAAGSDCRIGVSADVVREFDELLGEGHIVFTSGNGGS
ncbi:MAG: hypothetical protein ACYTAN_02585 [Planctomycetota bacterium]